MPQVTPQEYVGQQQATGQYVGRLANGVEPALSQAWYGADFGQAVRRFFQKAFSFRGYASRAEFWWAQLGLFGLSVVMLSVLAGVRGDSSEAFPSAAAAVVSILVGVVQLFLLVPGHTPRLLGMPGLNQ